MSMGGSAPESTTTTQKTEPWDKQKSFLTYGFDEAKKQYNDSRPEYFPGSTVIPFSPETQTAQNLTTMRALNGSPINAAGNAQLTNTLNDQYLYGGEGFDRALTAATNKALPMVDSRFEQSGRFNSGLAKTAQTQAIGDAFAGQYGQERENQMRSMMFAPQMANQDYADIGQLASVGGQREAMSAQELQDQMSRFDFGQNQPSAKLSQYMNLIQGNYGNTQSTTSPLYRNQGAGMLGGALGGLSAASSLGALPGLSAIGGPWGMAAGAGLGMLMNM